MKLKPTWEFLLIKRELIEKTDGGIFIPEEAQKRNLDNVGVVEDVGPNVADWVSELVGQEIVFKRHGGDWLRVGKDEYFLLHEEDIIATVER